MSKTINIRLEDTPAARKVLAYLLENVTTQEMENAMSQAEDDCLDDPVANAWRELECRIEDALDA